MPVLPGPPRESLVSYDPPVVLGTFSGPNPAATSDVQRNLAATRPTVPSEANPTGASVVGVVVPPREWVEQGKHYVQGASTKPASRLDVVQLQEALDSRLMQRQARESGICRVREELYAQCFDELIRQVCLESPERGLFLARLRDEIRMTATAYQTLFAAAVSFGSRKQLLAEEGRDELEMSVQELAARKAELEAEVAEARHKLSAIERRESERRALEDKKRREEVDFLKHQEHHLSNFLKSIA